MSTPEIKMSIHQMLDDVEDPEILALVYAMLKKFIISDLDEHIIGFEADGTPVTDSEFVKSVLESSNDAKSGQIFSQKEMKALLGLDV